MRSIICSGVFAAFLAAGGVASAQELLPLASFAQLPHLQSVSISPNGRFIAAITAVKDRPAIATFDLNDNAKLLGVVANDKNDEFSASWCNWANDERLLCGFRGVASDFGDHYYVTRLVAMDPDTRHQKIMVQNGNQGDSQFQDDVIDWSPGIPDTVLIQAVAEEERSRGFPSVYELNVRTGSMRLNTRSKEPIREFATDHHGHVRLGWGYDRTKYSYFARLDGQKDWTLLTKFEAFTKESDVLTPFAVAEGNILYASKSHEGREALWKMDLTDKEEPSVVFSHPLVDADAALLAKDGRMLGVFYETEEPRAFYTDPRMSTIIDMVNKALPGMFNVIHDMSADEKTVVIKSSSDRQAGEFYVFDTVSGRMRKLGAAYPDLPPEKLARMRWIHYPAKDGTTIPGYLTIPIGAKPENLPLIVMPHGGPIARDSFEYDSLLQFLVNRGYGVLQMNFRGSSGYGSKWIHAAHQDWGGLTYSDITDATRWAIAQKIADPARICIVGWSFGGYAALLGATRNSDLYRCSVSIAGVSDLVNLEFDEGHFATDQLSRLEIGTQAEKLKNDSPRRHAQDVKIPLLMVHGTRDAQVEVHHSRDMASALKSAGKPFEYVEIDGGNHNLWRVAERTQLMEAVEKFLAMNLGSPPPTGGIANPPTEIKAAFLGFPQAPRPQLPADALRRD